MKALAWFVAIICALLALPLMVSGGKVDAPATPADGMPWQIELLADGFSRVLGLVPGRSTLDDARGRYGQDAPVALIAAPGEPGAVEAFFDNISAGGVTGKMILTLSTLPAQREQMLKRARKAEFMEGTTRRIELGAEDLHLVGSLPIAAIAFIPSANLDEQIILQRFGVPGERIRTGEHAEHFLYADKGLDLQLDSKGKELLQYVAPRDFALLRTPLLRD